MGQLIIDPGKSAEYLLAHKCLQYGYMVCWPSSSMVPYDLVVDNGTTLVKVQVKATFDKEANKDSFKINCTKNNDVPYMAEDWDLLACYIYSTHTWYILPISMVAGKYSLRFYPNKTGTGQYENFKEAWHLFKGII